jgi:hypothetical protein
MRSKAAVLAEDISTMEEYISFGKELANQLNRRWGINSVWRSDGACIDSPSILAQLRKLQEMHEKVAGNAVGKGFEEMSDG